MPPRRVYRRLAQQHNCRCWLEHDIRHDPSYVIGHDSRRPSFLPPGHVVRCNGGHVTRNALGHGQWNAGGNVVDNGIAYSVIGARLRSRLWDGLSDFHLGNQQSTARYTE